MKSTWARLSLAAAIDDEDRRRLGVLGVDPVATVTAGDPGIDSAAARYAALDPSAPYLRPLLAASRPTIVAGSTWPSDEAVLLPALSAVRERVPELLAIVAPHEPDVHHVEGLAERLRGDGWSIRRLGGVERAGEVHGVDVVVVDRVGVLAHLYAAATASFVGGGFHDAGLHSVLEPAAAASPVVFGPRHANSRAAADLLRLGGAKIAANSAEVSDILTGWLDDPDERARVGAIAERYIEGHRGAATRCAERLSTLLRDRV